MGGRRGYGLLVALPNVGRVARYPPFVTARALLHSIQVSQGGVPKRPIPSARIRRDGVEGDRQTHADIHGGPERAVCVFSLEVIERLRAEGHPIEPGSTGDNLTVSGIPWRDVRPGSRLRVGSDVLLEIASHTKPCATIAGSFADGDPSRIAPKKHPEESRLYARVLREGVVRAGDAVLLETPGPGAIVGKILRRIGRAPRR